MKAIAAQYAEPGCSYTFLTEDDFSIGDFAVVPAPSVYDFPKVVKVTDIDNDFQMPENPPFQYKKTIFRIPAAFLHSGEPS